MGPDEVCRMAFTSGTTGDPKCVLHNFNTTVYPVRLINDDMGVTELEVFLIYLPVGLNWGYILLMQTIMAGARAVLMERFSARAALELIERERITFIATAPASIVAMLNEPDLENFDLSSLRVVVTGGASAPIETIREFRKRMKGNLVELYGMLESGFHTYTRFTDDPEKVSGTIGRVVGDMELRIIDAEGNDVPHGEIGEIAARGPSVHLGYHNRPSPRMGGFGRAISAGSSTSTATSNSPAEAKRSSIAAARSSSLVRSKRSSTPIQRSCTRRLSACQIHA
jgi:acyl-CoA synthetase (AMP-forming)/AMP-acid ligase II